jgi:hypothetical protein
LASIIIGVDVASIAISVGISVGMTGDAESTGVDGAVLQADKIADRINIQVVRYKGFMVDSLPIDVINKCLFCDGSMDLSQLKNE